MTRWQIAYVGRAEVFAGTIADNLRLDRPEISPTAIREALSAVKLTERVARLPDGLQTSLTPDGYPLSNNEIGRLSIARAIIGKPRLLLVDGSLDSLDLDDSPEVLDTLFDPSAPWTLVIVSARHEIRARCGRSVSWS